LRVGVGQAHDGARDGIETAAEKLAVKRLADGLAGALKPARADGDVGAGGDGGEEASASSMGAERSASVNMTTSPKEWRMPLRTL
jgi:hypothetical protein